MSRILASATRWLNRRKRTQIEIDAYLEGMFDAGISNAEQAQIEQLFKQEAK